MFRSIFLVDSEMNSKILWQVAFSSEYDLRRKNIVADENTTAIVCKRVGTFHSFWDKRIWMSICIMHYAYDNANIATFCQTDNRGSR